jgi:hypothetical protein
MSLSFVILTRSAPYASQNPVHESVGEVECPTMKSRKVVLSCYMMVACLCQTCARPGDESLQLEMKANIGKIAYNAANGVEIGTIVGVTAAS